MAGWLGLLLGSGRGASGYVRAHSRFVSDLMTQDILTATKGTHLEEVVALMEKRHVKRLSILRDGRLVGIVSRADLVRALGRALKVEAMGGSAGAFQNIAGVTGVENKLKWIDPVVGVVF